MRFPMPNFPREFEILDEWWVEAGMRSFKRRRPAYRSTTTNTLALDDIEPLYRRPNAPRDWHGFRRVDLVSILKGFVADDEIPPIELLVLPPLYDLSGRALQISRRQRVSPLPRINRCWLRVCAGDHARNLDVTQLASSRLSSPRSMIPFRSRRSTAYPSGATRRLCR